MNNKTLHRIEVVDSHTAGEPTRVVIAGGPDLGNGSLASRKAIFQEQFDDLRSAIVNEPRGYDALVGALLCEPTDSSCAAGVIFFNNAGYLNMCGHGLIGLAVTLVHLGRIGLGTHRIETPVGVVGVDIKDPNTVLIENVPSYRHAANVSVDVEGYGTVTGDVAWGGNWFFLANAPDERLEVDNLDHLLKYTAQIRVALEREGITGADGGLIDHIELTGPARGDREDGGNFMLCPGGAYDRSPCGTGTCAKIACLVADGKLVPGQVWRQGGILGTVFEGSYRMDGEHIIPSIRGKAYVSAESTLLLDPADPLAHGWSL